MRAEHSEGDVVDKRSGRIRSIYWSGRLSFSLPTRDTAPYLILVCHDDLNQESL